MVASSKEEGAVPKDTDMVQNVSGRRGRKERRRQSFENDAEDAARALRASGPDEHDPDDAKRWSSAYHKAKHLIQTSEIIQTSQKCFHTSRV